MSLEEHRRRLEETRDHLAAAIDECESKRDLAPLAREYRMTLADLEKLPAQETTSDADEIAKRRAARTAARRSKADDQARP